MIIFQIFLILRTQLKLNELHSYYSLKVKVFMGKENTERINLFALNFLLQRQEEQQHVSTLLESTTKCINFFLAKKIKKYFSGDHRRPWETKSLR